MVGDVRRLCFLLLLLVLLPFLAAADDECSNDGEGRNKTVALRLRIAAIFSILVCGGIGVLVPVLGRWIPALRPEKDVFFVVKAFAAGVIIATAFVHILPDAFENLTSPCLDPHPWSDFPFAGFTAMVAAIGTLMIDTIATGYFTRVHGGATPEAEGSNQIHTHSTHAHTHVVDLKDETPAQLIRHRVISQAKFKRGSIITMGLFFSLTTPVGIAIGIGVSSVYNENSPTALIVEGLLNSVASGILVYMALVDLLAADFMNPKVQGRAKLQLMLNVALLLGAGLMSLLAKWA
ncbi:hypothetical protein ZIOFF_010313 [Zingiber officinale]|uniref:Uncharacterized protein n=1 Tax=Zingiber officinale TaxID=94328 RepID=A0A8J5HJ10_ZINOF|nr:hypothetical protein ZIOFF_014252 [Zingiber officinale]KAG6528163.1 hypothetical protein ZIOFF_010313 [Zingiber officinale]